jgi:alkaline phosphatase D
MAVDFKTFISVAPHVLAVKKPILLRGRHGVGKSQIVYQVADGLNLPVIERRASQMTEGDLVGLPSIDGDSTTFNPPDWFKYCCDNPCVLFLDEVDRATVEVRQGFFELTDSRKLNGCVLHRDTLIIAAVNGGEHGEQYQVGEMDPAELDRWTVFDVEPTMEDWLDWAKPNVDALVWDFINNNRAHLEHTGDFEPNKVYPSRRSWDRFNECVVAADLVKSPKIHLMTLFNLASSFVGFEAAVSFRDFAQNYSSMVTPEDIIVHGKVSATTNFKINDHLSMVEKMESKESFKDLLDDSQIENLGRYFLTLNSEVAMKLWTVMGTGEINNTIKLHACIIDGKPVSSYLVNILVSDQ